MNKTRYYPDHAAGCIAGLWWRWTSTKSNLQIGKVMKIVIFVGSVLLVVMSIAAATSDVFEGTFTTEENGEFAVLTLAVEGSRYSGAILLDGYATPVTAVRRGKNLRGELHERDGKVDPFVARRSGVYLIMEFDDGAMIVFRRDPDDLEQPE